MKTCASGQPRPGRAFSSVELMKKYILSVIIVIETIKPSAFSALLMDFDVYLFISGDGCLYIHGVNSRLCINVQNSKDVYTLRWINSHDFGAQGRYACQMSAKQMLLVI